VEALLLAQMLLTEAQSWLPPFNFYWIYSISPIVKVYKNTPKKYTPPRSEFPLHSGCSRHLIRWRHLLEGLLPEDEIRSQEKQTRKEISSVMQGNLCGEQAGAKRARHGNEADRQSQLVGA
jgi:hypothetical protein